MLANIFIKFKSKSSFMTKMKFPSRNVFSKRKRVFADNRFLISSRSQKELYVFYLSEPSEMKSIPSHFQIKTLSELFYYLRKRLFKRTNGGLDKCNKHLFLFGENSIE